MVERVVIDASVAMATLVSEVKTRAARAAFAGWSSQGTELVVPSHFWIEVVNALVRRHARPTEDVIADLFDLDALGMLTVELDRTSLLLGLDGMAGFRLSAYDAVYLALAQTLDARLATLDRRLAEAAGERGLLIGSSEPPRLAEERADYGSGDVLGWAHSATVGAHIAELRRRAIAGTS